MRRGAFTLVELLVVLALIGALAALGLGAATRARTAADGARCLSNLRQLGFATALYLGDHGQKYFAYRASAPEGTLWYFGLQTGPQNAAEGDKQLDATRGPLFPYIQRVGSIEVCPAFPYDSALWKPKFQGASYGYGYNIFLANRSQLTLSRPSGIIVFGDCAQVNTFQPPASPSKPMLEEFYMIDNGYKTIHFRHRQRAHFLFADGHVAAMEMEPGTLDTRLPEANIGRITRVGSMEYLQ